ncbi:MAG: S41 family peptidase [Planctomycetota bacterium]
MPLRNFVAIAIAIAVALACSSAVPKSRYANLFAEALEVVEKDALEEYGRRDLFDTAVSGMLESLDEHSMYFSGAQYRAFEEDMQQEFGGVGMFVGVDPRTKELVVVAAMPNTPAAKAGLASGDVILEISGVSMLGKSREDAVEKMRGPKGKPVVLQIRRDGETREVTLIRDSITTDSVQGDWLHADGHWDFFLKSQPTTGYIRISQFSERTVEELRAALKSLDGKIENLILDLRMNSGGLLEAAVEISSMFLPPGEDVVRIEARNPRFNEQLRTRGEPLIKSNVPIVVLVNRHSASASEIVAACLQDHGRAQVVGERSYGKGTVQNVVYLERKKSAIRLTTARYVRPSGKNIDRRVAEKHELTDWGVSPSDGAAVEQSEEQVFEQFRQRNLRDLAGLQRTQRTPRPMPDDGTKESELQEVDAAGNNFRDPVLEKAIEVLKSSAQGKVAA